MTSRKELRRQLHEITRATTIIERLTEKLDCSFLRFSVEDLDRAAEILVAKLKEARKNRE